MKDVIFAEVGGRSVAAECYIQQPEENINSGECYTDCLRFYLITWKGFGADPDSLFLAM